jgi:hypothetical protein
VPDRERSATTPWGVRIARRVPTQLYPFERYFGGFAAVPAVRSLFGRYTARVLRAQRVEFFSARFGYMSTSDVDGHLIISSQYLKNGSLRNIYLDVVHELCHVRQFRRKERLFYPQLSYVDAPSEIEAYRITVAEGRRIGMTDAELLDYLTIEWITPAELARLARRVGVKTPPRARRAK